ncbi:uncharacterized protein LOC8035649 isoform X1 [Ixodes scapularis]|uniref:uncharacterized protein LOC8035649 isoform X1 n=1 Tax=Ixodes scapularis TaxID=6945 RepID=UPI001C38007E|nr:uncharacterized protein LOC8035649 isoform X1 [Ixodes scapularis]XP_029849182.3 uncharacterized protein LOC8035649 isoform X1 [Ixodes scapularis]
MMKVCAVSVCDNTGTWWHPFPKKGDGLRAKWVTAVGLTEEQAEADDLFVCSRHFRPFDYAERGVVRKIAVPSMRLSGQEPSPSKPKFKPKPSPNPDGVKRKRKTSRELILLEAANNSDLDQDSPQSNIRPSRKAARVAALKISDTVRKYDLAVASAAEGADSDEDFDLAAEVRAEGGPFNRIPQAPGAPAPGPMHGVRSTPYHTPARSFSARILSAKNPLNPDVVLPLLMECDCEPLSVAQKEAHSRAARAYSRSVRKITEAKAMGAKLIYCCPKESYNIAQPLISQNQKLAKPTTVNLIYDARSGMLLSAGQAPLVLSTSTTKAVGPTITTVTPAGASGPCVPAGQPVAVKQVQGPPQGTVAARPIPLITGGTAPVTANSLLMVKVMPSKLLPGKALQEKAQQLEAQFRRIVEGRDPVPWLVERGVVRTDLPCKFCQDKGLELQRDPGALNGYSLCCRQASCQRKNVLPQPSFFARFGLPLWRVLVLVYHWAVQSDAPLAMRETGVDSFLVRTVWRALQEVCARAVAIQQPRLGGPGVRVEVATAQMGRYLVLAALDRSTMATRLKAVSVALGWHSPIFLKSLEPWLRPGSVVVTEDTKFEVLQQQGFTVHSGQSAPQPGPDLVHAYLKRRLTDLFGRLVVNQLKLETVQGFLDELQWRERFGVDPKQSFWSIMTDLLEHSGWKVSFDDMLAMPGAIPVQASEISPTVPKAEPEVIVCDSSSEDETSSSEDDCHEKNDSKEEEKDGVQVEKQQPIEAPAAGPDGETSPSKKAVVLDEYYYARKGPCSEEGQLSETKGNFSFKCPICKKLIVDNVKTVKHITNHIEGSRQKNPDLSDLTICKYCFKEFETPYSMQCHMEVAHLKDDGIVCRICSQEFDLVPSLIDHMKLYHNPSEMPYSCQLCGYRSSFHKDVLKHFHQDHLGSNALLCRFCLRVYVVKFSNNLASIGVQKFYCHLFKHLARTSARRCPVCCLVFLSQGDMRAHKDKEHLSMQGQPGVETILSADASPILVPEPHVKPRKPLPSTLAPAANHPSACQPRFSVPAVHLEPQTLHLLCLECRKPIDEDHFNRSVRCSQCNYSTNCTKAFADHMICRHSSLPKSRTSLFRISPTTLRRPGICPCGFRSLEGNILIAHMLECDHPTAIVTACGPTTRRMKPKCLTGNSANYFPPLISLDDEETNLNEPFSEVFSSSVSNEFSGAHPTLPTISTALPPPVVDRDSPSILNMLGLMRRPSFSSSHEDTNDACNSSMVNNNSNSSSSMPFLPQPAECSSAGPKSAGERRAAKGLPTGTDSDSEPPVLEPQNGADGGRCDGNHFSNEAPSLEPEVELVEGEAVSSEDGFAEQQTRTTSPDETLEKGREEGRKVKEKTWPKLEPCIVLDSTA